MYVAPPTTPRSTARANVRTRCVGFLGGGEPVLLEASGIAAVASGTDATGTNAGSTSPAVVSGIPAGFDLSSAGANERVKVRASVGAAAARVRATGHQQRSNGVAHAPVARHSGAMDRNIARLLFGEGEVQAQVRRVGEADGGGHESRRDERENRLQQLDEPISDWTRNLSLEDPGATGRLVGTREGRPTRNTRDHQ